MALHCAPNLMGMRNGKMTIEDVIDVSGLRVSHSE